MNATSRRLGRDEWHDARTMAEDERWRSDGTGREKKKREPHQRSMERVNRNMRVIWTTTMKSISVLVRVEESCV